MAGPRALLCIFLVLAGGCSARKIGPPIRRLIDCDTTDCEERTELTESDRSALLVLRSAWHLPDTFWNESRDPCGLPDYSPWPGIFCTKVSNQLRVVSLSNPYLAFGKAKVLTGTLPPELGNLTALQGVTLDSTELTGRLPASLGALKALRVLSISEALLTGPLPAELGGCSNLTELNLANNLLSGPISPRIAPPSLAYMNVTGNYLIGVVPDQLAILPPFIEGNCLDAEANVTQRSVDECNSWYEANRPDRRVLETIRDTWLPNGWFDSEDPCSTGGWAGVTCDSVYNTQVTGVDLSNTGIDGDMSQIEWGDLLHLETLILTNNPGLQGMIPSSIGELVNLTTLYLDRCALHGPIPDIFLNGTVSSLAVNTMKEVAFNLTPGVVSQGPPNLDTPPDVNFQGNWFNGTIPPSLQSIDLSMFSENCLQILADQALSPQRSDGQCADFYRQVAQTPSQFVASPRTFPFDFGPHVAPKPPVGSRDDSKGGLVAEYIIVIVTIVVASVIGTLVGGWWYRRRRRTEHWRRLPKDEVPQEDWQFEAIAADLPQYSISKLKQLTGGFAAENCLEGQPLLAGGQDPQTSLMLMQCSSNSIQELFTLHNSVSIGCLYRGFSSSTSLVIRQLPPCQKEDKKKRKEKAGPGSFMAALGAMRRAEHPNLAQVRAYNRSKNRSCFIIWEGFGRTMPITVRAALEGETVKALSGEQDSCIAFLDWATRWRVMKQVASALVYLHEQHEPNHPHGFLTSSRIILGKGGQPFLTDYHLCTHLEKNATIADDIYDFGVLLFELIRGQPLGKGEAPEQLVKKAVSLLTVGHVSELLDTRLGPKFQEAELSGAVAAAAMCMQSDALERPRMSLIVETFERSEALAQEMEDPFAYSISKGSFDETDEMAHFLDKNLAECEVPDWASSRGGDVEMTAVKSGGFERPPMSMRVADSIWGNSSQSPSDRCDHSGEQRKEEAFERPPMTMKGGGSIWGNGSEEASSAARDDGRSPLAGGRLQGQAGPRLRRKEMDDNASDKYRSWMMGGELQMHPEHIKLGALLGQGSFGRVYHAVWLGTDIAVKIIPDTEGEGLTGVWREIAILRKLRHPNIVLFMAAVEVPSKREVFIVTEYLARGSLFDVLHREHDPEPVSFSQRLSYALGVARGMGFLHLQGLVHRDLKTGNLLVGLDNTVKVCDFGQSRLLSQKSSKRPLSTLRAAGTISYMAPEVFRDPFIVDQKCDVYSFGVILWELLARKVPWAGVHEPQVITSVASGLRPPIREGEWSPDLVRLIEDCWQDPREKRPTFEEVMVRLEAVMRPTAST